VPKLAVLVACSQVLFDEQLAPSLIGVFTALDVMPPPNEDILPNAMTVKQWVVCTMWLAEDEDLGKTFVQKLKVIAPNGMTFGEAAEEFKMDKRSHTLHINVAALPVGLEGSIFVEVWLESNHIKIAQVHKYEIIILHRKRVA
jgi:hypothetical protein